MHGCSRRDRVEASPVDASVVAPVDGSTPPISDGGDAIGEALARSFVEIGSLRGAADLAVVAGRICALWDDGRVVCARDAGGRFEHGEHGRAPPGARFVQGGLVLPSRARFELCVNAGNRRLCAHIPSPTELLAWVEVSPKGALTVVEGEDDYGIEERGTARNLVAGSALRSPPIARMASAPPGRLFALRDGRYAAGSLWRGAPDVVHVYDAREDVIDVAFAGTHAYPCLLDRERTLRCCARVRGDFAAGELCDGPFAAIPEVAAFASGSQFGVCALVASGELRCVVPLLAVAHRRPAAEVVSLRPSPEVRRLFGVTRLCFQRFDGVVACAVTRDLGAPAP